MESLDDKSIDEFEDEIVFGPEVKPQKTYPMHAPESGSCSGGLRFSRNLMLKNQVYSSLKKVVFSSKLNLLMPFGPLAILADRLTGHRVSCCCLWLELFVSFF